MTEEAKAAEEIAKATSKPLDTLNAAGRAIAKYFGGSLEQISGIIEDKLRYLRWERSVRLLDRADLFLANRGLDHPNRPVPIQLLIPVLEAGSLEENDQMQDRWSALLANAADASFNLEIRRAFVSILEDLTPLDAANLEKIYSTMVVPNIEAEVYTTSLPDHTSEYQEEPNRPSPEVEVSLANLARLGLITSAMMWSGYGIYGCVYRTVLGTNFLRAITAT